MNRYNTVIKAAKRQQIAGASGFARAEQYRGSELQNDKSKDGAAVPNTHLPCDCGNATLYLLLHFEPLYEMAKYYN